MRPMLDGGAITDLYDIKPGKAIKFIIDEEIKFQILNPTANYDDVKTYLMGNREQFLA